MKEALFRHIAASLFPRQRPVAPALRRRSLRRRGSARILVRPCELRQDGGFPLPALRPVFRAPLRSETRNSHSVESTLLLGASPAIASGARWDLWPGEFRRGASDRYLSSFGQSESAAPSRILP